jgi:hypothetical protein
MIRRLVILNCLPFTGSTRVGMELSRLKDVKYIGESSNLDRGCSYCTPRGIDCVFWPPDLASIVEDLDPETRYELILNRVHAETIIDGSKFKHQKEFFKKESILKELSCRLEIYSLLLVRNLEDWIISFALACDENNPQLHFSAALDHYVEGYSTILQQLHNQGVRSLTVRTEDTWSLHPGSPTYDQLVRFLNLTNHEIETESQSLHQLGGNQFTIGNWRRDQAERDPVFDLHRSQVCDLIDGHPEARQLQARLLSA